MSNKITTEEIQLRVLVDGDSGRKKLAELGQEAIKLNDELKDLKKGSAEAMAALSRLGEIKAQQEALRKEIGLSSLSLRELQAESAKARAALRAAVPNTEQWVQAQLRVSEVKAAMGALTNDTVIQAAAWEKLRVQYQLTELTEKELGLEATRLKAIMQDARPDTEQYKQASVELEKVRDRQEQLTSSTRKQAEAWETDRKSVAMMERSLEQLGLETKRLQSILSTANPNSPEYAEAAAEMALVKDRTEQLTNANRIAADAWEIQRKEIALVDMTTEQLGMEMKRLQAILSTSKPGTEEYHQTAQELAVVKDRVEQLTNANRIASESWELERKNIAFVELSLEQLGVELKRYQALQAKAVPNSAEYKEAAANIALVKERTEQLTSANRIAADAWEKQRGSIKLTDMTMEQLELEAKRLREVLRTMVPTDPGFSKLRSELNSVEKQTASLSTGLGPMGRMFQSIKTQALSTVAVIGGLFAGGAIVSGLQSWVTNSAKLSDAQAEVQRTTGLTKREVEDLTRKMSQFNTRTARSELLELAKDAGKLGISAEKDVLGFVRAGDKINVALGEELGEGAIETLGKLNQTFKVTERSGYDMERSLLASGSAVNSLANASTASGAFIVDYSTRLGGVNTQAKISIENTFGYAAALDQLGQRSETSSTAISRFTLGAFKDTAAYAKIAGLSVKDFTKLLGKDANEALLKTLEGLNGNSTGLAVMTEKFADMKEEGARAVGVLASLASNTKLIRDQQAIANKTFAEGTSVLTAFDNKNSTFGANLDILGKKLGGLFVNSSIVKGFNELAQSAVDFIRVPVSEHLEEERISMEKTYAQILSYNVGNTDRTRLIRELQAQYPGFLSNIDAETVNNTKLGAAVRELNTQLVNKIILQKKDEQIQDGIKAQAEQQQVVFDQEDEVRTKLVKLAEKNNLEIKAGVPLLEQSRDLYSRIEEIRRKSGKIDGGGQLFDEVARFGHSIVVLSDAYDHLNSNQDINLKLTEERAALLKRLGITETVPTPTTAPGETAEEKAAREAAEAAAAASAKEKRDKVKEQLEQLRRDLQKLHQGIEDDSLSSDQKELAQLDEKYAELRRKMLANSQHTADDLKKLDALHVQDFNELLSVQADKRLRKEAEDQAKGLKAYQDAQDKLYLQLQAEGVREAEALVQRYDKQIEKARAAGQSTVTLEKQRYEALLDLAHAHYSQSVIVEMQTWDEIIAQAAKAGKDTTELEMARDKAIRKIGDKRRQDESDAEFDHRLKMKAIALQRLQDYSGLAGGFASVTQAISQLMEQKADEDGKRTELEKKRIRDWAMVTIAAQAAAAIAAGIYQSQSVPFPGNIAAALSTVATLVGLVAQAESVLNSGGGSAEAGANAGAEANLNEVPIGADGMAATGSGVIKSTNGGGVLDGPSHADEGLKVVNPKTGRPVAEVEGGELMLVLSKAATGANADLIPRMLDASRKGQRMDFLQPPPQANPQAMQRAMRIVHMGSGGSIPTVSASSASSPTGGDVGNEIINELRVISGRLERVEGATRDVERATIVKQSKLKATLQLNPDYDRKQEYWANLKAKHTITRRAS